MDTIKVKGTYVFEIRDKDGNIKEVDVVENTVVNAGKAQLALLAGDATADPFKYLAVGTDSTAVSATDTALGSEVTGSGLARAEGTVSRETTSVTNDTLKITHTWTATADVSVEEVGVFNASTGGTMLSRALSSKTVANGETLTLTYKLQFS